MFNGPFKYAIILMGCGLLMHIFDLAQIVYNNIFIDDSEDICNDCCCKEE